MENKDMYSIQELFEFLPITIRELANRSDINEVTLARIRDGARTRRDTANKLMLELSKVYGRDLNIRNVGGINLMTNLRLERKEKNAESKNGTQPLVCGAPTAEFYTLPAAS